MEGVGRREGSVASEDSKFISSSSMMLSELLSVNLQGKEVLKIKARYFK